MSSTGWEPKHVVWAVDGFSEEKAGQEKVARCLKALLAGASATVEPVQVASHYRFLPLAASSDEREVIRLGTEQHLDQWLSRVKLPGLREPHVIWRDDTRLRAHVAALLEYAREVKANLVAASTHARVGVDRLLLGSFAESLLLQSELPVLIVPPTWRPKDRIETILFPHDMTGVSSHVFADALSIARSVSARLRIVHKMEEHSEAALTVFRPLPEFESIQEKEAGKRKALVEKLVSQASNHGVKAEGVVDLDKVPVGHYLSELTSTADLVVMAAQTGTLGAFLIGSVARQVVRGAHCPVLVFHPRAETAQPASTRSVRLF